MKGDIEVFSNPFDDPPEASAEREDAATIYMRVPKALKTRLESAASDAKLSGNVWAMRCIERCLDKTIWIELVKGLFLVAQIRSWAEDPGKIPSELAENGFRDIEYILEFVWKRLGIAMTSERASE